MTESFEFSDAEEIKPSTEDGVHEKAPDAAEEERGGEIDNVVPSSGFGMMPVVGLGGSAGSIDALTKFFTLMPSDSGMAFVVVLHLSPEHDSILAELLQRVTTMRVVQARDAAKLEPNSVYVIPPGKHLSSMDGRLRLTELEHDRGRRVAVDLFFRTLADTHGPHSTAVVLSGADGDGAIGIKRIKERGGLTIAQDPAEAEQTGMPRSAIETGMVDWVLPVEQMPQRLLSYRQNERRIKLPPEDGPQPGKEPEADPGEKEAALREVLVFLRTRTGRDFSYYKRATILRRISRRMQVNGVEDLGAYLLFLRTNPGEAGALLQDMLISVTNFFRDRDAFEALEKQIPVLFRGKGRGDSIRVWVPACATGEEAYSIAILLSEYARKLDAPPGIQIFASDLDENAIHAAREGVYPETIAADVSEERLRRYFIQEHRRYRVRREVREMVLFALHDLVKESPFSRLDLISCRNLLIYLNPDAQRRVFEIFHFALNHDGRLFLGSSESVEEGSPLFAIIDKKHRIYVRRAALRPSLPVPVGTDTLLRALEAQQRGKAGPVVVPANIAGVTAFSREARQGDGQRVSWEELHFKLIERLGPASLIVSREYDILHVSENAARFLHFAGGEPSMNLLKVVHPALRVELRAALFRCSQTNLQVDVSRVPAEIDGVSMLVDIRVSPADELAPDYLLVVFSTRTADQTGDQAPARPAPEPAVRHLEQEVDQIKTRLRYTVEQYEASTEELKASNEELQAMNEELRSAMEELETSREELQAINEELTTVNQELKSRADQLAVANSDIQNLMSSTAIPTVFLDRELHVMRYTPSAVALFRLIPGDLGRPLTDLKQRLEYPELREDAERVLAQLVPVEREVGDDTGRWYIARVLPYRTTDDRIAGVVFTFVDITERRQSESALHASTEEAHQARKDAEAASRAKDDILASLSHELRTPLNPVLMTLSALESDPSFPSDAREQVSMMRGNIELEARLIDDLLDATRIRHGMLQLDKVPVDIHEAIQRAVQIVHDEMTGKQLQLELELKATDVLVSVDPARLQQVFWNLLKNAFKFTGAGGRIKITTRTPSPGRISISFSDTGIGIRPDCMKRIFLPFDQGDLHGRHAFGGLGLGLTISKAIVNLHGGELLVESDGPGKGSIFTVELATISSKPEGPRDLPPEKPHDVPALRLLIVEDDPSTLSAMGGLLRRDGHTVFTAHSANTAFEVAAKEKFDLLISDVGLRDGSGIEVMRRLKKEHGCPGIALSGYGTPADIKRSTEAGFSAHLIKPVGIAALREAIKEVWKKTKGGSG